MRTRVPLHGLGRVTLAPFLVLGCGDEVVEGGPLPAHHGTTEAVSSGAAEVGSSDHEDEEPTCGDGVVQEGEECDGDDLGEVTCQTYGFEDGIVTCSPNCRAITNACWTCGDGVLHPAKVCDGEELRGETCESQGFASGTLQCAEDCRGYDTSKCAPFDTCGNGVLDAGEQCDGSELDGHTCQSFGFDTGTLSCTPECVFDTSGCSYHPLECGTNGSFCWEDSQCCPAGVGGNTLGNCYGFCT